MTISTCTTGYLHRRNPLMKSFFEWKSLGHTYAEPVVPEDFLHILEMVRRHEGEASAQIAGHWLQQQPQAFLAFRSLTGELIGFMATLKLELATHEDIQTDPAVQPALQFIQRHGALRPGEEILHLRFSMGRDTYQNDPAVNNLVSMGSALYWLTHPQLAWSSITVADRDYWQPFMSYYNHWHSPEADFEVGGRRYSIFTHDWRTEPADVWMTIMGEREIATDLKPEMLETTMANALIVLSQPEFEEAVRSALRDYPRPDLLATNPLLRSRVMADRAGTTANPEELQTLLSEAAASLKSNPKDAKLYHALQRTYFDPAPTQEVAAELLDLPFSTYRYHLTNGIKRITEWLWQRELYGS